MKWNWGTKIALVYIGFVVFILIMVALAFSQQFDLVTEDYYAQEIAYQGSIERKARAEGLEKNLKITIEPEAVKVLLPQREGESTGNILCFRPSDAAKDVDVPFTTQNGEILIARDILSSGKYTFKMTWAHSDITYEEERVVILP